MKTLFESAQQTAYQEFFKKKLEEYGVTSPAELSTEDKSKFFTEIKKEWPDAKVNESVLNETNNIQINIPSGDSVYYMLNALYDSYHNTKDQYDKKQIAEIFKTVCNSTKSSGMELDPDYGNGDIRKARI